MGRTHALAAVLGLAVFGSATSASAAGDANGFSQKGQLMVSADRLFQFFAYSNASVTSSNNGNTTTTSQNGTSLALLWGSSSFNFGGGTSFMNPHAIPRVAVDYTVIDHLTIGGSVGLAFGLGGKSETKSGNNTQSSDAPTSTLIGISPRVGYAIPLGEMFAIWPRGGFSFYSLSSKQDNTNNQGNTTTTTTTGTQLSLDLDPQFVLAPIPHLFFNAGPLVAIPLTGSLSTKTSGGATTNERSDDLSIFHMGISVGLGGWFDL